MKAFQYTTITVKVSGASQGILSSFLSKGIDSESVQQLKELGLLGWELVGVVPVNHGAVGASATSAAICFLKREAGSDSARTSQTRQTAAHSVSADANISSGQFDILLKQWELGRRAKDNYQLSTPDWELITQHSTPQALPILESTGFEEGMIEPEKLFRYYRLLNRDVAIDSLYRILRHLRGSDLAKKIIRELNLFDFQQVFRLLREENRNLRILGVEICQMQKAYYGFSDLADFESLRDAVKTAFPKSPLEEKRGLFGTKKVWRCVTCGKQDISESSTNCPCGADMHGIPTGSGSFDSIVALIESRIEILRSECAAIPAT